MFIAVYLFLYKISIIQENRPILFYIEIFFFCIILCQQKKDHRITLRSHHVIILLPESFGFFPVVDFETILVVYLALIPYHHQ